MIPITKLAECPTNPRKQYDPGRLGELVASVREHGILQPLVVRARANGNGATHEIVCGHRRYRAAKVIGIPEVPATVRDFTDSEVRLIQLAENAAREDLTPIEEAQAYADLVAEGLTVAAIAQTLGKKPGQIARRLPLVKLPKAVKEAMSAGHLPVGHAELIAIIPDPKLQEAALGRILYSVHEGEKTTVAAKALAVARRIVEDEFMTNLSHAVFDPEDAGLSPLGKCSACPHRSGNNPDLFGDLSDKSVCTNPKDFRLKTENHLKRLKESGYTVLLSKGEVQRAFPRSNSDEVGKEFIDLEGVCGDDPKFRTYEALLGRGQKVNVVYVFRNGKVRKLYPAKDIKAALVASGHAFAKEKRKKLGKSAASRSAANLERIGDEAVARELAKKLRTVKLAPGVWIDLLLKIVLIAEGWRVKEVISRHGYDGTEKDFALNREKILAERLAAMSDAEKRAFLVDLLAGGWFHAADKSEAELYKHLLKLAGVDYVKVANTAIDGAKKAAVEAKQTPKPPIAAKTARVSPRR